MRKLTKQRKPEDAAAIIKQYEDICKKKEKHHIHGVSSMKGFLKDS